MNNYDYCTWALNSVQSYYDKLLKLHEKNHPTLNLYLIDGQIDWALEERDMWIEKRAEYK